MTTPNTPPTAAQEALRLLAEMNAYFRSGNSVTPGSRKAIPTCEWVELHSTLLAALSPEAAEPAGNVREALMALMAAVTLDRNSEFNNEHNKTREALREAGSVA